MLKRDEFDVDGNEGCIPRARVRRWKRQDVIECFYSFTTLHNMSLHYYILCSLSVSTPAANVKRFFLHTFKYLYITNEIPQKYCIIIIPCQCHAPQMLSNYFILSRHDEIQEISRSEKTTPASEVAISCDGKNRALNKVEKNRDMI